MTLVVTEEPSTRLADYATVPIAFEVHTIFDVTRRQDESAGFVLTQRAVRAPYVKDYDAAPGEGPAHWAARFDLSTWGLFAAHVGGRRVGGAAVAFDVPALDMFEGRRDLAVLWDIRVAPDARGQGVGTALFHAAEQWARSRGCTQLKVETQNINVPACRFYERHGCVLGAADRFAYAELPNEVRLVWYKDLARAGPVDDLKGELE